MEWLRELPVSTTVGDSYRLVRRIGEGAQGAVYEARQVQQDRRCAVKIIDGSDTNGPEALASFQSRAETASRFSHPHLVRVIDFGTTSVGQPYLVMEYLEGEDLGQRLRRLGRSQPPMVSHVIRQIALGLSALHEQGLAHLALKPTNVFLPSGEDDPNFVKLLDFGTAQVENARSLGHASMLEDTLPYVAPEQASGRTDGLGERSDQWALACIAWHMLVGRAPFAGQDATALLYQIAYEDPAPVADAQAPAPVMAVLRRGLARRQEDRFPDIMTFLAAFEAEAGTLPPVERKAPQAVRAPARRSKAAPAAPAGAPEWLAPPPSEPVFLPGMTQREPVQPRRSAGAVKTRVQGVRVVVPTPSFSPAIDSPAAAAAALASPAAAPPGRWANFLAQLRTERRSQWLLVAALPLLVVGGVVASRGGSSDPVMVDVDRNPAPGTPPPAAPPGSGPVIVPLNVAPPPSAALNNRRKRGRGLRAKRAATPAKVRRTNVRSKAHRSHVRTR